MKKIFIMFIGLVIITGCRGENNKIVDDEVSFELKGNPSTGYEWECTSTNDIVDINYSIKVSGKDLQITGSPVLYRFKLKGKKEGETTIKCIYKRSWEETDDDKTIEYLVKVDSNLDVKLSEIK